MMAAEQGVYAALCDGRPFAVRVTPRAGQNAVALAGDRMLAVRVTAVPADGKANEAVLRLLAKALGVPKTRLDLIRGATGRDKLFRVLGAAG